METIDKVLSNPENPELTLTRLQEYRGHFAQSYIRILQFLAQSRTGLTYSWAEPGLQRPVNRGILVSQVQPQIELLTAAPDLVQETVDLFGTLEKADRHGSWRLKTGEGERSGKVKPGGPSLDFVVIGKNYRFTCIEQVTEDPVSKVESRKYLLTEFQET